MIKYFCIAFLILQLPVANASEQNSIGKWKCDIPINIKIYEESDRGLAFDLARKLESLREPKRWFEPKMGSINVTNITTVAQRETGRNPYAVEQNTMILRAHSIEDKELVLSCAEEIMKFLNSTVAAGIAFPSANDVQVIKRNFGSHFLIEFIVSPFNFIKNSKSVW